MAQRTNRQWRLASRPAGMVDTSNFTWVEEPVPTLERDGQVLVENLYRNPEGNPLLVDEHRARDGELSAEIEQVVLHLGQARGRGVIRQLVRQQNADCAVEFVDTAQRLDARRVLAHARPISQSGTAIITGTRDDSRQAIPHAATLHCRGRAREPHQHAPAYDI